MRQAGHREPTEAPNQKPDAADRARVLGDAFLPVVLGGAITRRRLGMGLAERVGWDARGVAVAERLHRQHGEGPLTVMERPRRIALVLDPADARYVLEHTPRPFSPAAFEKRAALGQFQPHGVLISDPDERESRRRKNEEVLATDRPLHPAAERFVRIAGEEVAGLVAEARADGVIDWPRLEAAWWRTVRRITLGDLARDDTTITRQLDALRGAANWAMLSPRRRLLRAAFRRRLNAYAARAEEGTLVAHAARLDAVGQIPHWLFAYDVAGIVTARALALLATHPETAARARREVAEDPPGKGAASWPLLRATVLESVRLWPTTPLVLRENAEPVRMPNGDRLPANTLVVIYAPYLHRGDPAGPDRDRFNPDLWLRAAGPVDSTATAGAFVPFSDGPAGCPGQNLVLLTTSAFLAQLLAVGVPRLLSHRLGPDAPLPATQDHFSLRFGPPVHAD
ncbi:cytochrome P450 [Streptomyces durbertensis]|uniref:Cytochrome P450 n=1 Tax=Streptomyces durbertensis TaxID=2448886 RepID=A0ABR6EHA5_9ACTN|nr:cytochrome P450 [Streptomyces durbertensis]MBB1244702.1 cytochrome P450 [Streptomyces durbertensis]